LWSQTPILIVVNYRPIQGNGAATIKYVAYSNVFGNDEGFGYDSKFTNRFSGPVRAVVLVRVSVLSFELQGGPKTRPLHDAIRLTADVFETHEPICVIFGKLQRRFVLNT